jgi:phage-related protein
MSVLSKIKAVFTDVESDLSKFAAAFVKLFKKAPSALQAVENFTGEVAPVIIAAVALADPAVEPAVAAALATAETLLAAVQASATAAASGQSLLSSLQNFASTVPTLLTGLTIKNATLKSTIEKIVTLVTSEAKVLIPAVESWVKQIAALPAVATK